MIYTALYLFVGLLLASWHYFRNDNRDIKAIAEVVAIMLVWLLLGLIYIITEAHRTLRMVEEED